MKQVFVFFAVVVIGMTIATTSMAQAGKGTKPATSKKAEAKKDDKPKIVKDEEVLPDDTETGLKIPMTFDTSSIPDDELTAAIKDLLTETGALNIGRIMSARIVEAQKKNPNNVLPDEFYDLFMEDMAKGESSRWVQDILVRAYRTRFTTDEIKIITAFYRTPAGKKLTAALPDITQETMAAGEKVGTYVALKIYYQLQREGKVN